MNLPELSADAAPEFVDPETCKVWLEHVPLASVTAAQHELFEQIEIYNRFPTAAAARLPVMEALREAVNFVQIEQAKRFTNRALPMAEAESAAFDITIELWEQMRVGYLHCLAAALNGDTVLRPQAGLVCQRVLAYSGLKMFHHYRAYREVPAFEWRQLNEAFGHALQLNAAEEAVKDFLNRDISDTSPRIAYARAVLMGMCNPNELAQRQLTFVAYLLERWAGKLELAEGPVVEGEGIEPLVADLDSDRCPQRVAQPAAAMPCYLDARKLAKSLRNRVGLLRKGESPAKLALGEDCVQPSCEQLLVFLYRQWCQTRPGRSERKPAGLKAQACNDLAAVHHYISGKAFKQPKPTGLTQQQQEEMATFGRVSTRDEEDYSNTHGYLLENWEIRDESAQGLRMLRPAGTIGRRLTHGQLMGVRPADSKRFMLTQVRWLMQGEKGDLHAGLKVLPGVPGAVAVRATGLNVQSEEYTQGLALGAVPAVMAPATLVVAAGWYKPKRVIELLVDGNASRVRLTQVIDRGADFERVAYEAAA